MAVAVKCTEAWAGSIISATAFVEASRAASVDSIEVVTISTTVVGIRIQGCFEEEVAGNRNA